MSNSRSVQSAEGAVPASVGWRTGFLGGIIRHVVALANRFVPGIGSNIQRALIRSAYSGLSTFLKKDDSSFLNYGYVSLDANAPILELEPRDENDRYSAQLYARVIGACDLHGKDLLEVGCGRGGGASFLARYFQPASFTGVDLAATAVRYCQRTHHVRGLKFLRGEAENLPFSSNSFDVVLNVESSHCYPSFERFLKEVTRVLRPNGIFLFADLRGREDLTPLREQLSSRFIIREEEFITENVLKALHLDSDRRRARIQKAPEFLHNALNSFAGVSGSPIFEAFSSGAFQYIRFVLQKKPID